MAEVLGVYNPISGSGQARGNYLGELGLIDPICFSEFITNPSHYLTPEVRQVVVAGGDGTILSVIHELAVYLPATAAIEVLVLPKGAENVVGAVCQIPPCSNRTPQLVADFLAGKLDSVPIPPFGFTETGVVNRREDIAFWSLGAGVFAPVMLDHVAKMRDIKQPYLRKYAAALKALLSQWQSRSAQASDELSTPGRDIAFVSRALPYWTKFLNVRSMANGTAKPDSDYIIRMGKPEQSPAQTVAGILFDFAAYQILHRGITDTLQVVPVNEPVVVINHQSHLIAIDSEVRPTRADTVEINRHDQTPRAQILLAQGNKAKTQ